MHSLGLSCGCPALDPHGPLSAPGAEGTPLGVSVPFTPPLFPGAAWLWALCLAHSPRRVATTLLFSFVACRHLWSHYCFQPLLWDPPAFGMQQGTIWLPFWPGKGQGAKAAAVKETRFLPMWLPSYGQWEVSTEMQTPPSLSKTRCCEHREVLGRAQEDEGTWGGPWKCRGPGQHPGSCLQESMAGREQVAERSSVGFRRRWNGRGPTVPGKLSSGFPPNPRAASSQKGFKAGA